MKFSQLLIVVLFFCSSIVFGQEKSSLRFSLTPFMTYSTLNASKGIFADIKDDDDRIPRPSISVTGSYAFSVFGRHRLSIGLGYANWNGKLRDDFMWGNDPGVVYDHFKYLHAHELTLPIDFWFYTKGDGLRFFAKPSVQPSLKVGFKGYSKVEQPDVDAHEGEMTDRFEKFNIAGHLALGLEKKVSESISIFVAPDLHVYFKTDEVLFLLHDIRRSGLGLEMGLNYTLNQKKVVQTF